MKNFIRGLIALTVAVAIVFSASRILLLKSEDGISQMESLYKQKKDSVDVLFLGSSRLFCNVRTGVLWDEYGISSFNLCGAETPSWTSYYHLKEALKTQHPKVVVYEVTVAAVRPTLFPPIFWVEDNIYGMKWNMNRIKAMKMQVSEDDFKKGLSPLSAMHDRYKELTKNDFIDENNSINYKGFDERESVNEFEAPNVTAVTERIPVSEQAEEYIGKIIDTCEEAGIPLILVAAPFAPTDEQQAMINYMFDIGDKRGIEHIDFNACYQDFGLDYSTDMADEFHMNSGGTMKFSKYIGECLKDRFELQDHRGDPEYSSWDVDAALQRQQVKEVNLNKIEEDGKYLLELVGDEYLIYLSLANGAEQSETLSNNRNVLNRLGLKKEYFLSNGIFVLSGGEAIYGSIESNQRAHIRQNDTDLLLLRQAVDDGYSTSLYVDRKGYGLDSYGIKIIVFDKVLNRVVSERELPY